MTRAQTPHVVTSAGVCRCVGPGELQAASSRAAREHARVGHGPRRVGGSGSFTLEGGGGGGVHPASPDRGRGWRSTTTCKHKFCRIERSRSTYNNMCWHASPKHEGDVTTNWQSAEPGMTIFPTPRSTIEAGGLRNRCSSRPVHHNAC